MAGRNETWRTKPEMWRKLQPKARTMRREPTGTEAILWDRLRAGRLDGVKFRRQHPIDRFMVDYFAPAHNLAIEVDGASHDTRGTEDGARDAHLSNFGIKVLRVRNEDIAKDLDSVLAAVRRVLHEQQDDHGPTV